MTPDINLIATTAEAQLVRGDYLRAMATLGAPGAVPHLKLVNIIIEVLALPEQHRIEVARYFVERMCHAMREARL